MTTITIAAKTATRRAEESERISRLSLAMLDRIARQPGAPDMVLHHVASALADLASVLLATTTTTTEGRDRHDDRDPDPDGRQPALPADRPAG